MGPTTIIREIGGVTKPQFVTAGIDKFRSDSYKVRLFAEITQVRHQPPRPGYFVCFQKIYVQGRSSVLTIRHTKDHEWDPRPPTVPSVRGE